MQFAANVHWREVRRGLRDVRAEVNSRERVAVLRAEGRVLAPAVAEKLAKREPFYSKAKHILDVNKLDSYEKVKISVSRIRELTGI